MPLIIKLESSNRTNDHPQWAIIELQGDLECRTDNNLQSQFIGDLYYKTQTDGSTVPILIIGHHILNGKEYTMEKPIAVMEREVSSVNDVEFNIKAIITKKIIFKTRPKPIIGNY